MDFGLCWVKPSGVCLFQTSLGGDPGLWPGVIQILFVARGVLQRHVQLGSRCLTVIGACQERRFRAKLSLVRELMGV